MQSIDVNEGEIQNGNEVILPLLSFYPPEVQQAMRKAFQPFEVSPGHLCRPPSSKFHKIAFKYGDIFVDVPSQIKAFEKAMDNHAGNETSARTLGRCQQIHRKLREIFVLCWVPCDIIQLFRKATINKTA